MAGTEMIKIEGSPDQLYTLIKSLPKQSRYRVVEIQDNEEQTGSVAVEKTQDFASIALLNAWIEMAPTSPEDILRAEDELLEFKRNLNRPRKESGERLHFPEAE